MSKRNTFYNAHEDTTFFTLFHTKSTIISFSKQNLLFFYKFVLK